MDEDAGGDVGIAVPQNYAKNSQEYVLPGKPTGHLGSSQKEGKVKTCIKCKFDFIAKGKAITKYAHHAKKSQAHRK